MTPDPPENSYGIAKRLAVIRGWVGDLSARMNKPRLDILDFGCGTGDHLTMPLASLGHSVLGVDLHADSIADATRRHDLPSLRFRVADLDTLLSESLVFDVVLCSEVLEHVDDPGGFLAKLRALTANDGAVMVTTPNGYGAYEILCTSARVMKRIGAHELLRQGVWTFRRWSAAVRGAPRPSRPLDNVSADEDRGFLNVDSGHVQFFSMRRLEVLFKDAGLRIVQRRSRTLLCGPYADAVFALCPWRGQLFRWNNRAADILPFAVAADWMFLLGRSDGS
jgi:2-polyprenyl-3-methyl-5-hydroxy-6-metoxy-1,4-benzoquinol methylase